MVASLRRQHSPVDSMTWPEALLTNSDALSCSQTCGPHVTEASVFLGGIEAVAESKRSSDAACITPSYSSDKRECDWPDPCSLRQLEFAVFSCRWLGGSQRVSKTGAAVGGQDLQPYNAAQAV